MSSASLLAIIALLGSLGVLVRFGLSPLNQVGAPWPWGTFLANVLGCFLILLVVTIDGERLPPKWARVLAVGLLGGLTTFSSYILELHGMAGRRQWGLFSGYLAGTHLAAFAAAALGAMAGRAMMD